MPNVNPSINSPRSVAEHPSFLNDQPRSGINAGFNGLPAINSPRSVAEHPSFLNDQPRSGINAGLNGLPAILPRNSMVVRLPASLTQGGNNNQIESTNRTYFAANPNVNPTGPMPNFPSL